MKAVLLLSFLCFSGLVSAQQYVRDRASIASGGGSSTGAVYRLSGTVGQHDAGRPLAGGAYLLTGGFWAAVVQSAENPSVSVNLVGDKVVLYWVAKPSDFALESKASLSVGNWSLVSSAPVTVGGVCYVTNTIAGASQFYRLRKQ